MRRGEIVEMVALTSCAFVVVTACVAVLYIVGGLLGAAVALIAVVVSGVLAWVTVYGS